MNTVFQIHKPVWLALVLSLSSLVLQAHAENKPNVPAASATDLLINLNTATEVELTKLPGVGPARAQAIVALRTRRKGFKTTAEILRVRGIGRKTYRKLKPMITVGKPPAKPQKPSK